MRLILPSNSQCTSMHHCLKMIRDLKPVEAQQHRISKRVEARRFDRQAQRL